MNAQEVKSILKASKEAYNQKDFKEALRLCRTVIEKDKENYLAWVFTGAAALELGNSDQAVAAFQRAIQISSEQAPAWQGLSQYYERSNMKYELVSVYSTLRKIFANDPVKWFDYSLKYSNSLISQDKIKEACSVLYGLLVSDVKDKDKKEILEKLANLLAYNNIDDQPSEIYFKVIESCKESKIDLKIIKKIEQNALILMKKEHKDWKLILEKCFEVIQDPGDNQNAVIILIQIPSN